MTQQAQAEALSIIRALREWVEAVPADVAAALPAMPGVDADWMDAVEAQLEAKQAAPQKPDQFHAALDRFDAYFRSANGVPPNARISVPTAEWQELRAMLAAQADPGWKRVPVEPTEKMQRAIAAQFNGTAREATDAWSEALAAAPTPPA